MAGSSSWSLGDQQRAPERLGSKISTESSLNDFLCCSCALPVVTARQSGCGCRLCDPCYLLYKLVKWASRSVKPRLKVFFTFHYRNKGVTVFMCGKCYQTVNIHEVFDLYDIYHASESLSTDIMVLSQPCLAVVPCGYHGFSLWYRLLKLSFK